MSKSEPEESPLIHTPPPIPPQAGAMTTTQTVIAVILLFLVLWVAYRIGKVILRVVAGLLFLGLACYGIWYLLIR